MLCSNVKLLLFFLATVLFGAVGSSYAEPPNMGPSRLAYVDSTILLTVSSCLQENDSQYVHDLFCMETGKLIGTVRSRWAHKYGHRYGGVGIETTGKLEYLARLSDGKVRLRILSPEVGQAILVVDRLIAIPD